MSCPTIGDSRIPSPAVNGLRMADAELKNLMVTTPDAGTGMLEMVLISSDLEAWEPKACFKLKGVGRREFPMREPSRSLPGNCGVGKEGPGEPAPGAQELVPPCGRSPQMAAARSADRTLTFGSRFPPVDPGTAGTGNSGCDSQ